MSGKNWTTGPWSFEAGQKSYVISALGFYDVCVVRNIGSENNRANANLIAAAPDLYGALEKLLNAVDSCIDLTPELLQECTAALSRARGEAK